MKFDLPPIQPPVPKIRLAQTNHQEDAIEMGMKYSGCNRHELKLVPFVLMALQGANFQGAIIYYSESKRGNNNLRALGEVVKSANSRGIKVAMVHCRFNQYDALSSNVPHSILGTNQFKAASLQGGWVEVWVQR